MSSQKLSEILSEGLSLAASMRAYVAKLLSEAELDFVPASLTSGILLGLSFLEESNALIKKEIEVLYSTIQQ